MADATAKLTRAPLERSALRAALADAVSRKFPDDAGVHRLRLAQVGRSVRSAALFGEAAAKKRRCRKRVFRQRFGIVVNRVAGFSQFQVDQPPAIQRFRASWAEPESLIAIL